MSKFSALVQTSCDVPDMTRVKELHSINRFPEHTKALLVHSFICTMNQQSQMAWSRNEAYGESSQFFWDLREEVSHQLSTEVQWQYLKEEMAFPEEPSWFEKLENMARTEVEHEELRVLKQCSNVLGIPIPVYGKTDSAFDSKK